MRTAAMALTAALAVAGCATYPGGYDDYHSSYGIGFGYTSGAYAYRPAYEYWPGYVYTPRYYYRPNYRKDWSISPAYPRRGAGPEVGRRFQQEQQRDRREYRQRRQEGGRAFGPELGAPRGPSMQAPPRFERREQWRDLRRGNPQGRRRGR